MTTIRKINGPIHPDRIKHVEIEIDLSAAMC